MQKIFILFHCPLDGEQFIILWGVRINESVDDDAFYTRTNRIAHDLDPSRATSGVRYLEKSHLLEDVYAYNDFSHKGNNPGAKRKKDVSPDPQKAFLISECNGHMYPTKPYDDAPHRQEHALRHARVLDAAYGSGEHAGCFGWCMFDYSTHKDFGSGDRICYHGVLDSFRNPKLAASVYSSQGETPTLAVSSSMDIGDYPAGQVGSVYVFTNVDTVELYKNDVFVTRLRQSEWKNLPHPPLVVDDTIGVLLETQEKFDHRKAAILRDCLLSAGKYGLPGMPLGKKLKMGYCMLRYHMSFADGVALYGKYVGNWGGAATRWRFDAKRDGKVVQSVTLCPSVGLHLEVRPTAAALREGDTYDMASCPHPDSGRKRKSCPLCTAAAAFYPYRPRRTDRPGDGRGGGRHGWYIPAHHRPVRRGGADGQCPGLCARFRCIYHFREG